MALQIEKGLNPGHRPAGGHITDLATEEQGNGISRFGGGPQPPRLDFGRGVLLLGPRQSEELAQ